MITKFFMADKSVGNPLNGTEDVIMTSMINRCYKPMLRRPYPFKFFKGCLPQILLGPFLNTLSLVCNKKEDETAISLFSSRLPVRFS